MILSQQDEASHIDYTNLVRRYLIAGHVMDRPRTRTSRDSLGTRNRVQMESEIRRQSFFTLYKPEQQPEVVHPLMRSFRKYRVMKLVKVFTQKLKRNIVLKKPYHVNPKAINSTLLERLFGEKEGIEMDNCWIVLMEGVSLAIITWLVIIYTLVLVFHNVEETGVFFVSQLVALIFYTSETAINFFVKSYEQGKAIDEIKRIVVNRLRRHFWLDAGLLILLVIDLCSNFEEMAYWRMLGIFRFFISVQKMDKIQAKICTNSRREQQWGLVLLFAVNFLFAHLLSICLNSMTLLSDRDGWWQTYNLTSEPWYVKYIFGYYWGINIMLTVGFGDFVATNWMEALCLIFIEVFSCIIFSYNINCVGNLINNLRLQQVEKEKNLKNFRRMCENSSRSNMGDLENRINHFIEKLFEIKKSYDVGAETETLSILPEKLSSEFLRRANSKVMENLYFFKDLNKKCLGDIAYKLEKRVALPEQIIIRRGDRSKLLLLYRGQADYIGYQQKRGKRQYVVVQRLPATNQSRLLSFQDCIKQRQQKFDIMSADYSVLYSLQSQHFAEILRSHKLDYERYCELRDNHNSQILFQGLDCIICNVKCHTKFDCPRLHYIPLRQLVCLKYKKVVHRNQKRSHADRNRQRYCNINTMYVQNDLTKSIHDVRSSFLQSYCETLKNILEDEKNNASLELDKMYVWKYYSPVNNIGNCLRKMARLRS